MQQICLTVSLRVTNLTIVVSALLTKIDQTSHSSKPGMLHTQWFQTMYLIDCLRHWSSLLFNCTLITTSSNSSIFCPLCVHMCRKRYESLVLGAFSSTPCSFVTTAVAYLSSLHCLSTDLLIQMVPVTNHVRFGQT